MVALMLSTKERILEAGGEVFGKQGFKAATIRRICKLAGVNIASVNYHFRDKEGLYAAVIEDVLLTGFEKYPPDMGLDPEAPPEDRLHAFIRSFLFRLLGNQGWWGTEGKERLIARELADPSPNLDWVVEKYIKPHKEILVSIISELLGPPLDEEKAMRCCFSIVGQCLHYAYARPIILRLYKEYISSNEDIEKIANHITDFSLGGIRTIRKASAEIPK